MSAAHALDGTVWPERRSSAVPSAVPSQDQATPGFAEMERFERRQPRDVRARPRITKGDDRSICSIPISHKDINMMNRNSKRNATGTAKAQSVPAAVVRFDRAELRLMAEASVPTYKDRPDLDDGRKARVDAVELQLHERFAWASAESDRVRAREARIAKLANKFGWGARERAVIDLIREAAEAGLTGAYVPAQRIIEKVDGTVKSHDMIGGSLDHDARLIAWYAAMRADWTARGVPWFGMILVLVSGFEIKRAAAVIQRREQWLRDQIRAEIEHLKAALDKGGVKRA